MSFHHVEKLRVRYADTDQMGVVYYANYLRYFEAARTEYLRAKKFSYRDLEADGSLIPVIEAHVRYRLPARFDDELEIETWLSKVGSASVRFEYLVRRGADLLAEGWSVHACIGRDGKAKRFPETLRAVLVEGAT